MQQDRLAGFGDHLEDRQELRRVERHAIGVGAELHRIGAVVAARARPPWRPPPAHSSATAPTSRRNASDAGRPLRRARHWRSSPCPAICPGPTAAPSAAGRGTEAACNRRTIRRWHPQIDVGQRRNAAHALAEVLGAGRRFQQRVVIALREKMIEGIDGAHGCFPLFGILAGLPRRHQRLTSATMQWQRRRHRDRKSRSAAGRAAWR